MFIMHCEGCTLFSIQDALEYENCFKLSQTEISDHCLNSRIAWNAGFYYQKYEIDRCFCLVSNGGVFTTPHITWPMGNLSASHLETILDTLWPAFASRGWPLRLMYIDENSLPLLKDLDRYTAEISYNPDFSDYLYRADRLRRLSGKTMRRKRNHFNRFIRSYPDYTYQPISTDDRTEALQLVKDWCDERELDTMNLLQSDYRAIRQLFIDMPRLDVRGGCIRVNGQLVAFALGSLIHDDTAVIHFEKATTDHDGLYAAINKLVLEHAFPDVTWVNREEDMGIAGLRKAKESYNPVRFIHKYEALLTRI
jgi:uncharacterized protein